jgi:hypothetical protein
LMKQIIKEVFFFFFVLFSSILNFVFHIDLLVVLTEKNQKGDSFRVCWVLRKA